ncbi:hypothetical protein ES705_28140 [subsurface metagenome]
MGCKLIKIGDVTAFICGAPKDHECNDDGPKLAFNDLGIHYDIKDRPDWHIDSDGYEKWMEDRNICGGCVSCSICKQPFNPPIF